MYYSEVHIILLIDAEKNNQKGILPFISIIVDEKALQCKCSEVAIFVNPTWLYHLESIWTDFRFYISIFLVFFHNFFYF